MKFNEDTVQEHFDNLHALCGVSEQRRVYEEEPLLPGESNMLTKPLFDEVKVSHSAYDVGKTFRFFKRWIVFCKITNLATQKR